MKARCSAEEHHERGWKADMYDPPAILENACEMEMSVMSVLFKRCIKGV